MAAVEASEVSASSGRQALIARRVSSSDVAGGSCSARRRL